MSTRSASQRRKATLLLLVPLLLAVALVLPACGSDEDASTSAPKASDPKETTTTTEAPAEPAEPAEGVIEVRAMDYAFLDLPQTVKAGTRFTLVNEAEEELHELVAIRLPDDEERSAKEIIELPQAELEKILMAGPPATVILAKPGGEQVNAVGDGTLTEPGRYIVACSIPTGADADEVLASQGPPPADAGGPPHFHHGMWAEVTVV